MLNSSYVGFSPKKHVPSLGNFGQVSKDDHLKTSEIFSFIGFVSIFALKYA